MTRLFLQALVNKTAAFSGAGVGIDTVFADGGSAGATPSKVATLCIHVESIDDSSTARIQVTDSVDNFGSDKTAVVVVHIHGGLTKAKDRVIRIPWYDIQDARFGVTSAKMKVELTSVNSAVAGSLSAGIKYEAWIEY